MCGSNPSKIANMTACAFLGHVKTKSDRCDRCGLTGIEIDAGVTVRTTPRVCPCGIDSRDCTYHR